MSRFKVGERHSISVFGNWLNGFWMLIGGHFRKKIDADISEHTFTEEGKQVYVRNIPNPDDCPLQKVWFAVEQPQGTWEEWNKISVHRRDDAVVIYADIESTPCKIKWLTMS